MIVRGAAILVGLGLAQSLQAQPELLVRLDEAAPEPVVSILRGELSKSAPSASEYATLFDRVTSFSPLLPGTRRRGADGALPGRVYRLSVPDSAALEVSLTAWRSSPFVAYAIPNRRYRLDTTAEEPGGGDPYIDSLQHLVSTRVMEAWSITEGEAAVRIGFVDTGVWREHPDLASRFWVNPGEDLNGNGVVDAGDFDGIDGDGNGYVDDLWGYDFVDRSVAVEPGDLRTPDPDPSEDTSPSFGPGRGHGTLVAGILGAARGNGTGIAGVAPRSRLVPLRAFANDGEGEDDDVARAIVYAADMGLEVLNLSFGDAFYSPLMHDAIRYAVASGTIVVASAGNDGGDWPHYPSDYPEVISVGWLSEDGTERGFRASHGVNLDLGAPGSRVYTTLFPPPESTEDPAPPVSSLYGRRNGSSVAAPIVSGVAALVRSVAPDLTPEAVRAVLASTATDIREPGWDQWTGAGRVDAVAALSNALPARIEITYPHDEAGLSLNEIPIRGSAISPLFDGFELSYAVGDDEPDGRWQTIASGSRQVLNDTLAIWSTGSLPDSTYVLRLAVQLKNGARIEDRRRVFLDRTPPNVRVVIWDAAWSGGVQGVFAEIVTDDVAEATMTIEVEGRSHTVRSDRFGRRGRRHGLLWTDVSGSGGIARSRIDVVNSADLATTLQGPTLHLSGFSSRPDAVVRRPLDVPAGYLMPETTDFDRDGLQEIVSNAYQEGALGDTLFFYEWTGSDFAPMGKLAANVFPRAVGDTDGDGLFEMLTQVSAVTLLLEQNGPFDLPVRVAFLDTTGIDRIDDDRAVWGTALTDVDGNGRGEILSHNRKAWRLLEWNGSDYSERIRFENPTPLSEAARSGELESDRNGFSLPRALVGDFDRDGRVDVLVGDVDGDFIVFECEPGPSCRSTWTYQTDRYNGGSRFASGDFDGDGRSELIAYTDGWRSLRSDREYEADYGIYYRIGVEGDDTYVLRDSLVFAGPVSTQGGLAVLDTDLDGRDELLVVYPPDLYIFRFEENRWQVVAHWGSDSGMAEERGARSIFVVAADFDFDGQKEVVVAGADGRMHLLEWDSTRGTPAPPAWVDAYSASSSSVLLTWYAFGADSVTVWRSTPGQTKNPVATVETDSALLPADAVYDYALSSWQNGERSNVSTSRRLRPHEAAVLQGAEWGRGNRLQLTFSEPLDPATHHTQFSTAGDGGIRSVVLDSRRRAVHIEFAMPPRARDTLRWVGLRDAERMPVPDGFVPVPSAPQGEPLLALAEWRILDASQAELVFSHPLDRLSAENAAHYNVLPSGSVSRVSWNQEAPERVTLSVAGRVLGAVGASTTIVVSGVRSAEGYELGPEGRVATLTGYAPDLSDVFVYPNPCRVALHGELLTVAGLPKEAEVQIFSSTGRPLRTLVETDGDGGVQWDFMDDRGGPVPSGIYLIRVAAEGFAPSLVKAALIR